MNAENEEIKHLWEGSLKQVHEHGTVRRGCTAAMNEWIIIFMPFWSLDQALKRVHMKQSLFSPAGREYCACHRFSFLGIRFVFKEPVNPLFQMEYEHYVIFKEMRFWLRHSDVKKEAACS